MRRSTGVRLVAVSGILALAATACGGSSTGGAPRQDQGNGGGKTAALSFSVDNKAKGPAYDVPGHTTGGVIHILEDADFSHLDPARIYVNNNQSLAEMVERQLNTYIERDGKITLVGDLATNTGETTDGGKTWKFTLRDGVKFEDGSDIKASDIKYAVERGFDPAYTEGPTYLYEWLAGKAAATSASSTRARTRARSSRTRSSRPTTPRRPSRSSSTSRGPTCRSLPV